MSRLKAVSRGIARNDILLSADKPKRWLPKWLRRANASDISRKVETERRRYAHRGLLFRTGWVALATLVTLAGVIMIVTPGPALILIPVGLTMLSFEFRWARQLLNFFLKYAKRTKEQIKGFRK